MTENAVTYFLVSRDTIGVRNHAHRSSSYGLNNLVRMDPKWADVMVRNDYNFFEGDAVKVHFDMGMVQINNRLLKMDLSRVLVNLRPSELDRAELKERLFGALHWVMRAFTWFNTLEGPTQQPVWRERVGVFTLYFGSTWKYSVPVFPYMVTLDRWGPRLRTYDAWLVKLQRWFRSRLNAKKQSLAFAMALHPRLGQFSGAACLGKDLADKICAGI
jgi:hypothetical protein